MTNPASSGGAGTHFEAKVGASYLLSMLLEVDARGLPGCRIESVSLQRSQEGHPLDDIVIRGVDQAGNAATLEIQVKRTLTFTASDTEFREVVKQIGTATSVDGFLGQVSPTWYRGRPDHAKHGTFLSGCAELGQTFGGSQDFP